VWDNIVEISSGIWEAIKSVADKVEEIVNTIWQIIEVVVSYVWGKIKDFIEKIKEVLNPIAKWIYDNVLKPAYDFVIKVNNWISDRISSLINGVKNIAINVANGVSDIIKRALNGLFSIAEDIINFFINGLNNVVDIVNSIPGVSISKVDKMSIPRFASGGFPDAGGLFIAREAGPELVGSIGNKTAVVNNDQIVESVEGGVYRAMRAAMQESGGGAGSAVIVLNAYLDGEKVYQNTVEHHNKEVIATGKSSLLSGE